jgi:hypothetical protein
MTPLDKKTIISWMPVVALVAIVTGLIYSVTASINVGDVALIGFLLGSAGRAIFPFYRKWKENEEELLFNYAYLMPIAMTVVVSIIAYFGEFLNYIPVESPVWVVYLGALFFAYGGVAALDGFKKWTSFLDAIWQHAQEVKDFNPPAVEAPVEEEIPVSTPPIGTEQ